MGFPFFGVARGLGGDDGPHVGWCGVVSDCRSSHGDDKAAGKKGVERGRKEFGVFEFQRLFCCFFPPPLGSGAGRESVRPP